MSFDQDLGRDSVRILAFGGSTRSGSSSELALRAAARSAEQLGAIVEVIDGPQLVLPIYQPELPARGERARALVDAIRRADGVFIASPGYHGTVSGLVKNALDYMEDLRGGERDYLDGLPVGCIAVAHGWQAAVSTLNNLRVAIHALRGWPTPLGVALNAAEPEAIDAAAAQLATLAHQVVGFAKRHVRARA
jgi:FMN reductase